MCNPILRGIAFFALLIILVTPLSTVAVNDYNGTIVRVLPAEGRYLVRDEINVEVWVEDVVDLYSADVRLSFDPLRFAVLEVTPRDDLLSPDFVIKQEVDNETGTVWYAVTQLNPREPASGSGTLFSFILRMLSEGQGSIDIQYWELGTRYGEEIPASTANALYTVEAGEPNTIFLPLIRTAH